MPSVGRKPKPRALKELAGNPGKRKLREEPKPPAGAILCPVELSAEAHKEWNRLVPDLEEMGVLTRIDTTALAAYCECWSRWVDAEKNIRKYGAVIKTAKGYPMQSPYLKIANQALDLMRKFMVEFGLTPSSRSRVTVGDKPTDDDGWDDLLAPKRPNAVM